MKPRHLMTLAMIALTFAGCAPKTDNSAVAALKKEKNAWEQESNQVAEEATTVVDEASENASKEIDDIQ